LEITLILFALSSGKYWIFLDYSPQGRSGDHFRSKELTFKLSLAIMKRWRNSFKGRGSGPLPKLPGPSLKRLSQGSQVALGDDIGAQIKLGNKEGK